jgi:mono/diheme cytochrome c family protein
MISMMRTTTTSNTISKTVLLLMFALAGTAAADPRTTNDAVYSKEQAKIGEQLYKDHCLMCHDKKYFRPVFKAWDGQSLGIMFTVMSASMPESNPGALPLQNYVDILAYILSLNRFKAGDAALSSENDALNEITIAQRKK